MTAKFQLGRLVSTPAALALLTELGISPSVLLARHASGDWGDLSASDKRANDAALADGSRIFSSYKFGDQKIWAITEAEYEGVRASTCLLLPSEY